MEDSEESMLSEKKYLDDECDSVSELVDSMETAFVGKNALNTQQLIFANLNSYHVKLAKRKGNCYEPVLEYVPSFLVETFYRLNWMKYTDVQGIFRVEGNQLRLKKLDTKPLFLGWQVVDKEYSVHDLCTLVKRFFREIEDPILEGHQQHILQFASHENPPKAMKQSLSVILHSLDSRKYGALMFTLLQLHNVAKKENVNSMSCENLAIVFAPTFFRETGVSSRNEKKKSKIGNFPSMNPHQYEALKKANLTKVRAVKFLIENAFFFAYDEQKAKPRRRLTNGKDIATAINDMRNKDGSISDYLECNFSSSNDNIFEKSFSHDYSKKMLKSVGHAKSEDSSKEKNSGSINRNFSLHASSRKSPRSLSEHSIISNSLNDDMSDKTRRFNKKGTVKSMKDFTYGKRKSNPSKRSSSVVKVLNSITNLASTASSTMANIWQRRGSGGPLEYAFINTLPSQNLNDAFLSPSRSSVRSRSSSQYSRNHSRESCSLKKTSSSEQLPSPMILDHELRSSRSSIKRCNNVNRNGVTPNIDHVIEVTKREIASFKYPVDRSSFKDIRQQKFRKINLLTKPMDDKTSIFVNESTTISNNSDVMIPIITGKFNRKSTIRCSKKDLESEKNDVENQNLTTVKDLASVEGKKRDVALTIDRSRRNTAPVKSMLGRNTLRRNQPNSIQSGLKTPKITRSNKFLNNENFDDSFEFKSDESTLLFKNNLCARSSSFHNGVLSSPDSRKPLAVMNMQRNDTSNLFESSHSLLGLVENGSSLKYSPKIVKRNSSEMNKSKNNDSLDDLIKHKKKYSSTEIETNFLNEDINIDVDIVQHEQYFSIDITTPENSIVTEKCKYVCGNATPLLPDNSNTKKDKNNITPTYAPETFNLSLSREDLEKLAPVTTSLFMSPRESITPDYDSSRWNKTSSLSNSKNSTTSFGSLLNTNTFLNVAKDKSRSPSSDGNIHLTDNNTQSPTTSVSNIKSYTNYASSYVKKSDSDSSPTKMQISSPSGIVEIFKTSTSEVNRTKTAIQRQSTGTWKETSSPTSFIPNVVGKMFDTSIEKSPMKLIRPASPVKEKSNTTISSNQLISDGKIDCCIKIEQKQLLTNQHSGHNVQTSAFGTIIDESPKKTIIHLDNNFKTPSLPKSGRDKYTSSRKKKVSVVNDDDFKNSDYMVDQLKNAKNSKDMEAVDSPSAKYANTRPSLAVLYKEKCGNVKEKVSQFSHLTL
ncbi:Rho GTPase-activating protein domain and Rho GTPase activation protein domain-containing protein [Strongyloides ratti]|uniref:Rho GTPase-activating protein domain and Rho GTPase activation protein domain-containing protein n=1 Tax=Strongyloides ratti TaxID=34506 RepID=A0A090LNH3_STRRB|nr:Rho GTPase-activating protein domain and Rho GTPase activation protein domain-containing protein [Strongyloides ratti]CEF69085.1 Rho GTPase-activating protein domain and Rho GTPase activation protein domain-containing protein [Strongyloides ratti]